MKLSRQLYKYCLCVVAMILAIGAEARAYTIIGGSRSQRDSALAKHYKLTAEEIRARIKKSMKFPKEGDVYTLSAAIPMFCQGENKDGRYVYGSWRSYTSIGTSCSNAQTYQALCSKQKTKKQTAAFLQSKMEEHAACMLREKEAIVVKTVYFPSSSPSSSGVSEDQAKQRRYASEYSKFLKKAIILVERAEAGDDEPRAGYVALDDLLRKAKR